MRDGNARGGSDRNFADVNPKHFARHHRQPHRETLAKVMVALDDRVSDTNPSDLEKIGKLALELGVELREDAKPEGPAAVAMWLFDGSVKELPGGYDYGELSPNSPVKEVRECKERGGAKRRSAANIYRTWPNFMNNSSFASRFACR